MTEEFINQKLNQLVELDYDTMPDNPLDDVEDSIEFFIETRNVVDDLIDNLFDGDEEAYQDEHDKYNSANGLFEGLDKIAENKGMLIYPITKYEHSQVAYYLGTDQGWDSGVAGFVLVDVKQAEQDYGFNSRTRIENYLDDLLNDFTNYANGDVYCIDIYQLNSKGEKEEMIDSAGSVILDDTSIEGLFDLGLLEGELKDWKEAEERVQVSYIPAE